MSYTATQSAVRERLGIAESAATLVSQWQSLVDECGGGYSWDVSELKNELRARDSLEAIIVAPELQVHPEHQELIGLVGKIDAEFRSLLQVGVLIPRDRPWWRCGVLRFAGREYAEYMANAYGFHVDVVE